MLTTEPKVDWFSQRDGYRTAVRIWPQSQPTARLVLLHGIISHGGWYLRSGEAWARAGLEVHLQDRRGSGLNQQRRGDADCFEALCLDVEDYLESLDDDAPRLLVGISWGGTLATAVARRRPDLIQGLVLACPGLFSDKSAGRLQQRLLRMASRTPLRERRIAIPLRDPDLFTNNPDWLEYVEQDPLTLRKMTLRFAWQGVRLTRFATEHPKALHLNTLLLLAGRDRIINNERTRQFVQQFSGGSQRTIEFPDAAHTLEFEPDPEEYFDAVSQWANGLVVA